MYQNSVPRCDQGLNNQGPEAAVVEVQGPYASHLCEYEWVGMMRGSLTALRVWVKRAAEQKMMQVWVTAKKAVMIFVAALVEVEIDGTMASLKRLRVVEG